MKRNLLLSTSMALFAFVLVNSCKEPETTAPTGGTGTISTVARVSGKVFDSGTSQPIIGASVSVSVTSKSITAGPATTDSVGGYALNVNLGDSASALSVLTVTKSGFRTKDTVITLNPRVARLQDVRIDRDTSIVIGGGGGTGSTYPNSIRMVSITPTELAVKGVGATETGIIIYEVRDSLGFPIDINHQDTVLFSVNPPSYARVLPQGVLTNAAGRVATTISSDTIAGSVQVVARLRRNTDGLLIQSSPVLLVIHAGLPDQRHFTIGAERFNFDAYDWLGRTNTILVLIGDKYSNPVQPGTAVYFNSTGGVIQAEGFTSPSGQTQSTIYSGNPRPSATLSPPSLYGNGTGYAWIYATTLGVGGVTVKDSLIMLFSATSLMSYKVLGSADTTQICFSAGGSQSFSLKVADRFGNPLAEGTTIAPTLDITADSSVVVDVRGLPTEAFYDFITRGPGRTDFTGTVFDATPGGATGNAQFTLRITLSGVNGPAFVDIPGRLRGSGDPACP